MCQTSLSGFSCVMYSVAPVPDYISVDIMRQLQRQRQCQLQRQRQCKLQRQWQC